MIQTNLALKLEEFEGDYCCPYLIDDSDKIPPDNIIQFHSLASPAGMRTSVGLADNSQIGYQYDNLNRLIDETKTLADTSEDYFNRYTFDAVGNRLTQTKIEKIEPTIGTADFDPNTLNVNSSGNFVTVYLTPLPQATDKAWITQINGEDIHPIKAEKIEADSVKFNRASVSEISKPYAGSNVTYTIFWLISDGVYTAETDQIKIIEKGNKGKGKGKGGSNNTPPPPPATDLPPTLQQVVNIAYAYNTENQLIQETIIPENQTTPSKVITYAYDNSGNLVEKNDSEEGITTYAYDTENRLTKITYPDSSSSEYVYDGVGKRIKSVEKDNAGTPTNTVIFLYDGLNVIIERDENNQTIATYNRGISYGGGIGGIVSKTNSAGESLYYHYDGLGTVTALTDSTSNVVQEYQYDAYGNMLSSQGNIENSHLFSTKEFSSKSGLIYFGARYYDSRVGRWISKDPYTWGPNDPRILATSGHLLNPLIKYVVLAVAKNPQLQHPYVYCRNNPINLIDPWGLREEQEKSLYDYWMERVREHYSEARNDLESRIIDYVTEAATSSPWSRQADAITLGERVISALEAAMNASRDTLGEATRRTREDINQALNQISSAFSAEAFMSHRGKGIFY